MLRSGLGLEAKLAHCMLSCADFSPARMLLLLQDMATLSATLEALACHAWAHTYTILLAMESKEVGAAHKAGQLQEQFGCSFHSIVFTLHVLDPAEMPGKASNVNSAVRQFYHMVTGDRGSYMMTIMDAGGRWCDGVRPDV
jgi:hypothetical protein